MTSNTNYFKLKSDCANDFRHRTPVKNANSLICTVNTVVYHRPASLRMMLIHDVDRKNQMFVEIDLAYQISNHVNHTRHIHAQYGKFIIFFSMTLHANFFYHTKHHECSRVIIINEPIQISTSINTETNAEIP